MSTNKKVKLLYSAISRAKWENFFKNLNKQNFENQNNLNPKNLKDFWNEKDLVEFFKKENIKLSSNLNRNIIILYLTKYYFSVIKKWKYNKIHDMKTFNKKSNLFYNQFFKYQYYQKFAKPIIPIKIVDQIRKLKIEWVKSDPTIFLPKNQKNEDSEIFKINNILADSFKITKQPVLNDNKISNNNTKHNSKVNLLNMNLSDYKSSITKKSWKYLTRRLKRTYNTFLNKRLKRRFKIQRQKKKKFKLF